MAIASASVMPPALLMIRSAAAMRRWTSGTNPNTRSAGPAQRSSAARSAASWPATTTPATGWRACVSTPAMSGNRPTDPCEPAIASTTGTSAGRPIARRAAWTSAGSANSERTGTPVTTTRSRGIPRATRSRPTSLAATQ